jgi:hypothetical protein
VPADSGRDSNIDSENNSEADSQTESTVVQLFPTRRRRRKRHLDARLHGAQGVALSPPPKNRWRWLIPTVAAASFVGLVGSALLNRQADAPAFVANAPTYAQQRAPAAIPNEPPTVVANRQLIRDARLDHYLQAHQQFAGSSALGVPSGYLRSATTAQGPQR